MGKMERFLGVGAGRRPDPYAPDPYAPKPTPPVQSATKPSTAFSRAQQKKK